MAIDKSRGKGDVVQSSNDYPVIDRQTSLAAAQASLRDLGLVGRVSGNTVLVDLPSGSAGDRIRAILTGADRRPRRSKVLAGTIAVLERTETRRGMFRFAVAVRG